MKILNRKVIGYAGLVVSVAWLVYYLKQVDISLIYYWQQRVPLSWTEYLEFPGGMSTLLAARFNEWMTSPLWGPVAIITLLALTYILLHRIFIWHRESPLYKPILLASVIPFVTMLAAYRLPMGLILAVVVALLMAGLLTLYTPGNRLLRAAYIWITGIITYLLAGPPGLLVFLQVCIYKYTLKGKYAELIAVAPLLLVIPLLYLNFNPALTLKQACLGSLSISKYDEIPVSYLISLFIPLVLMILLLGTGRLLAQVVQNRSVWLEGGGMALVTGLLVFSSLAVIDTAERTLFQIEQAGFNDDWQEVLELADEEQLQNKLVQFQVNRALFHRGVLLEDLFRYPQIFGEQSLFMVQIFSGRNGTHVSDFYADLGFANESRHWANESHMVMMRHPMILKQLVLSYLSLGKKEIALKYLGVLSGSAPNKAWCEQIFESVKENDLDGIPFVQEFISNNPEDDFFPSPRNPIQSLQYFYTVNPDNRTAFEFLMASYMLKHEVGTVIGRIKDFRRLGYDHLPRAIEEAVMIYLYQTKSKPIHFAGYKISPETATEFQDFSQLIASSKSRSEAMNRVAKYSKTYWYYVLYTSPYAKKSK